MPEAMPLENTFDHRREDGEHVGYIHFSSDDLFIPYDLLHRQRASGMELEDAESLLDELGLAMFTEDWWLDVDGGRMHVLIQEVGRDRVYVAPSLDGAIAKSVDMRRSIELSLPTGRLHQTSSSRQDEENQRR